MSDKPSRDRRDDILSAALGCFLERRYAATSIRDIGKQSGASIGSMYHFFAGKDELARALLAQAVSGWRDPTAAQLPDAADCETTIKASVRGLLDWAAANPRQFAFMDEMRAIVSTRGDAPLLAAMLDGGQETAAAVYNPYATSGAVRPLHWPIAYALMVGPAYAYLRLPPGRRATINTPTEVRELLAEAAWQAVKAPA